MSNNNYTINSNTYFALRALILISTLVLIFFAIKDEYRQNIPITLVVLAILIAVERYLSSYSCKNISESVEGFDRTDRLEWLNEGRGKLGQFYVGCKGCGRKKILQERIKSLYAQPPCGRYQSVGPCEGCSDCDNYEGCNGCEGCNGHKKCTSGCTDCENKEESMSCPICRGAGLYNGARCRTCGGCGGCGSCNRCARRLRYRPRRWHGTDVGCTACNSSNKDSGSNRSYCIKDCADNIGRDTVSLWNDDYITLDSSFCYNCALDLRSKIEQDAMTQRELPAPTNGPPGYSIYRDSGYTI